MRALNVGGGDTGTQPTFVGKGLASGSERVSPGRRRRQRRGHHPSLLRLRFPRKHPGDDGRIRPFADDRGSHSESRDEAGHEPTDGLRARAIHGAGRVGTMASRPASPLWIEPRCGSGAPSPATKRCSARLSHRQDDPTGVGVQQAHPEALERKTGRAALRRRTRSRFSYLNFARDVGGPGRRPEPLSTLDLEPDSETNSTASKTRRSFPRKFRIGQPRLVATRFSLRRRADSISRPTGTTTWSGITATSIRPGRFHSTRPA